MGLAPTQGPGSGKVAENSEGVNWNFLKSGGFMAWWPPSSGTPANRATYLLS